MVSDSTSLSDVYHCSMTYLQADLLLHGLNQCSETNVEQRFLLAEILKKSSIAPLDLMNFIQERGIQPSWYEMALPNGAQGKDREELARAEYMTYRALRLLMHSSLATSPSKLPGSFHGPCPPHGRFRTAVTAECFKAKEEASSFRRNCSLSSGPNDPATAAIQLSSSKCFG